MDAFNCGSIARWINHSVGNANLLKQCALTPEDPRVPTQSRFCYRICFFAMRDIQPGEELLYDYGTVYCACACAAACQTPGACVHTWDACTTN